MMEARWVVTPPARALSSSPLSRLAHVDRTFRIPEGQFYQIMPVPCGLGLYAATFKRIVLTAVLCFRSSPSPRATLWSVSDIIDRAARHHFRRLLAFTTSLHEFVLTLFVAGPSQRTLARQMFVTIRENISPAIVPAAAIFIIGIVRRSYSRCACRRSGTVCPDGHRIAHAAAIRCSKGPNCPNTALSLSSAALADGGHDRDRTCDPYHVKVVLSR